MSNKYLDKYRINSTRLQNWDYGWNAWYFVTIVTQEFVEYFGKIENKEVILNELGLIAKNEWIKTKFIRKDMNVKIGEFIIMPNHVHGLIQINKNPYNCRDAMHRVCTSNDKNNQLLRNMFGPQRKNLSSIIRGYKSAVTTYAKKNNIPFRWQRGFIDRIIWNDTQLEVIELYIKTNPAKWYK